MPVSTLKHVQRGPSNPYSGVTALYSISRVLQRGLTYIQYPQCQLLPYSPNCEANLRLRKSILYITLDRVSLVVYAILYMLLSLLYVLGTYVFVSLLLYSMHVESPPERVDKGLNTVASSKGLKHVRDKSYTHTVSRTHKEHH